MLYKNKKYAAPFRFSLALVWFLCSIYWHLAGWLLKLLRSKQTKVSALPVWHFGPSYEEDKKLKNIASQSQSRQAYFGGILCSYCSDLAYSRYSCSKTESFKAAHLFGNQAAFKVKIRFDFQILIFF